MLRISAWKHISKAHGSKNVNLQVDVLPTRQYLLTPQCAPHQFFLTTWERMQVTYWLWPIPEKVLKPQHVVDVVEHSQKYKICKRNAVASRVPCFVVGKLVMLYYTTLMRPLYLCPLCFKTDIKNWKTFLQEPQLWFKVRKPDREWKTRSSI